MNRRATIKMNAITEWSAAAGHRDRSWRDNRGDSDFSAFMSVWFLRGAEARVWLLMEYLRALPAGPGGRPEAELHAVRFQFDPAPRLETLMMPFLRRDPAQPLVSPCGRVAYRTGHQDDLPAAVAGRGAPRRRLSALHEEVPGWKFGDSARAAFAKIGVLMASAKRTDKALHPTNLHVNQSLFPERHRTIAPP